MEICNIHGNYQTTTIPGCPECQVGAVVDHLNQFREPISHMAENEEKIVLQQKVIDIQKELMMYQIEEIGEKIVIRNLKQIIQDLKRGDCWCEMAVSNPMVGSHSKACLDAQEVKP